MTSLRQLIESVVDQVIAEASPEAPKKSIAGEYLWADPEQDKRLDAAQERDTEEESVLLRHIRSWYITGRPTPFLEAIPIIEKLVEEGHYAKYFTPPKQTVYRFLSKLSVEDAAGILKIDVTDINKSEGQITTLGPGTLVAKNPVESWTIEPGSQALLWLGAPRNNSVSLLFKANPRASGNHFMLNPGELMKTFIPDNYSEFLADEMEVVALGDVHYESVAVFFNTGIGNKQAFKMAEKMVLALKL